MSRPTTWGVPRTDGGQNVTPTEYATRDDDSLDGLLSSHKDPGVPAYAVAGTFYIDDTSTPWQWNFYDGADAIIIAEFNPTANKARYRKYKGADIASASTLVIGNDGNFFNVTGTTNITGISTVAEGLEIELRFTGVLTLEASVDFVLLTDGDITTSAGDTAKFIQTSSTQWTMVSYARKNGQAVTPTSPPAASETVAGIIEIADRAEMIAGTNNGLAVTASNIQHSRHAIKAYVYFNGTGATGIGAQKNISSTVDRSTGRYGFNFAVTFTDANASIGVGIAENSFNEFIVIDNVFLPTATSYSIFVVDKTGQPRDNPRVHMIWTGDLV